MQNRSVLTLLMCVLVLSILFFSPVQSVFALQIGDKAPDFLLSATTAEKVSLADYLGKKPIVLFFYIGAFTGL